MANKEDLEDPGPPLPPLPFQLGRTNHRRNKIFFSRTIFQVTPLLRFNLAASSSILVSSTLATDTYLRVYLFQHPPFFN